MNAPIITSIINQKGGVGKTTSSLNISAFLAVAGKKVLLIDLDPQGNSSETLLPELDIADTPNMYHFLMAHCENDTPGLYSKKHSFKRYTHTIPIENNTVTLDVLPAEIMLSECEIHFSTATSREFILSKAFRYYEKELSNYDLIIIDCPPSLGLLTINAFVASRYLLVPVDASAYSYQGMVELVHSLGLCNETFDAGTELLGIFFAKYVANESVYKQTFEFLTEECGDRLFNTVINKSTLIEQAPHYNQTIVDYAEGSKPYTDYLNLTKEFLERIKDGQKIHTKKQKVGAI